MRIGCAKQVSMTSYLLLQYALMSTGDHTKKRRDERDQTEPSVT